MRYLTLVEVLDLHRQIIAQSTGTLGIRDLDLLKSAIAQPRMSFGGEDLYPTVIEKAIALGFSMIMNHPFVDGNKRTGHAALETFLILNGLEISASVDEQEQVILAVASGVMSREAFTKWLQQHITAR
jgi:death on curing protein